VAEAEAAFAALHERLLTGDPGVTQRAYAEAKSAIDFASARQEAAQRAAAQQAAAEQQQRFDDAKERLAALDTAAYDTARARLADALDELAVAVLDRSAVLGEIVVAAGGGYGPGFGQVALGSVTRGPLSYQRAIRDLAQEAVRRHFGPRQWCDLENPPD